MQRHSEVDPVNVSLENDSMNHTVSVIVPVGTREVMTALCLRHLLCLVPAPKEIVLICDGTNESAREAARTHSVRLVELPERRGPAAARNLGAFAASGDILFFVDADVLVPPDALIKITETLDRETGVVACFGSYDDEPADPNFLSQYKNLFHHFVHQRSPAEASTFWTGCGAIYCDIFRKLGGFNEAFDLPSVEDIEFGYRLRDAGYRTRLVHRLQAKHLKRWSARLLLKTDFFRRALPWSQLLLRRHRIPYELNLRLSDRLSGVATHLLVGSVPLMLLSLRLGLIIGLVAMLSLLLLNFPLYRFFYRKRGLRFSLHAVLWNWFYYFYSSVGFGLGFLIQSFSRWKVRLGGQAKGERVGARVPLE